MRPKELNHPSRVDIRRRAWWIGLAPIAGLALLAGCRSSVEAGSAEPSPATATRRDVVEQIPLGGQLVAPPSARADVAEPFQGTVERIYKSVGDPVGRGEAVVRLAVPGAQVLHTQTSANVSQAEQTLHLTRQQYQQRVDEARQKLKEAEQAVQKAQQAAAPQNQNGSSADSGPAPASGAAQTSPSPDLQQAIQARDRAQQDLAQAQQEMQQGTAPERQDLAQARAENKQARAAQKQGDIDSPIDGNVTAIDAQVGKAVDGDQKTPVFTVVNLSALVIQSPMTADQASRVKKGMETAVTFDELPGRTFDGRVEQITNPNGGYMAVISFKNTKPLAQPGYHPHVAIKTGKVDKDVVAVPAAAVDQKDGRWTVQVQQNGKWVETTVQPGISDGQFTEIRSGVQEGQVVKVTPGS